MDLFRSPIRILRTLIMGTMVMVTILSGLATSDLTASTGQTAAIPVVASQKAVPAIELPPASREPLTRTENLRSRPEQIQLAQREKNDDDNNGNTPSPQSPNFSLIPGSPDEVVYNFCLAMADDDTATAGDYVSPNAKGLLGQLRDGDLPEEKIEELVSFLKQPGNEPVREPPNSTKRTLRNRRNQSSMSFVLKKEKDLFRITDLAFTKPKR